MHIPSTAKMLLATCLASLSLAALSQEAVLRKNLAKRIPQLTQIDEVRSTKLPGLYEIRVNGSEIYYTDSQGNYLIRGDLIDTRSQRNLTEERVAKLTAIKFETLPFKDAFTIVRGNGERKLAVFEDPHCGYCKRFEQDLQKVNNITVYLFLYPILGSESNEKSKAIWCAKDRAQAWQDWMVRDQAVPTAAANCDSSALERNVAFGRKYHIDGTPTLIFSNGKRIPGAITTQQIEKAFTDSKD